MYDYVFKLLSASVIFVIPTIRDFFVVSFLHFYSAGIAKLVRV